MHLNKGKGTGQKGKKEKKAVKAFSHKLREESLCLGLASPCSWAQTQAGNLTQADALAVGGSLTCLSCTKHPLGTSTLELPHHRPVLQLLVRAETAVTQESSANKAGGISHRLYIERVPRLCLCLNKTLSSIPGFSDQEAEGRVILGKCNLNPSS